MTPPPQPLTSAASEQYSERTLSAARVAALKLRRASYTNFDPRVSAGLALPVLGPAYSVRR